MDRTSKDIDKQSKRDANRDPITGAPGAHPVGVGLGAVAGGAAAGAATGTIAGPIGTAVGAAVGAVVGGLAGKKAAEAIDPTVEDAYWRENYTREPYYEAGRPYDEYSNAYRTGYEGRAKFQSRTFEEVERDLKADYEKRRGANGPSWEQSKRPARAAWDRIDRSGDSTPTRR